MTEYRLFLKDAQGHILQRVDLDCPDDQTAIAQARAVVTPYRKDLWVHSHRLCEFPPSVESVAAACLSRWKNRIAPETPVA